MSEPALTEPAPLFYENGASWAWVWFGPAAALAMAFIQHSSGYGWEPVIPGMFLVLVSGFLAIQVKAARIHTSVELTEQTLRQGTETIRVDEIELIYPPPEPTGDPREKPEKWQHARTLGELNGVPRGRTGIGLRLTGGRTAQAWARHHGALRAALTPLVPANRNVDGHADGPGDAPGAPW